MSFQATFESLNLELPPAPKAIGLYKPVIVVGDLAYTSGHGPLQADKTLITGKVGDTMTVEEGFAAAHQTGLATLATLIENFGSLDRIVRLVKTFGLVNATPDFTDHPAVINGFSQLMKDVFGDDAGIAARSAVGAGSLPVGMSVEVEAVFQIQP